MTAESSRPDVVLILADDMGFSDIGCYGGEVHTPNLDRLAAAGARFTQFYNTARCSPSRASLMTGLHPHQVGVGILNFDDTPDGYPGNLSEQCVTLAEALGGAGYRTYLSGKWHLASDMENPNGAWPTRRGFDRVFGTLEGAGSYYQPRTLMRDEHNIEHEAAEGDFFYTDAITQQAVQFIADHEETHGEDPYFLYLAYTAPHWPLHARPEDVAAYDGRFTAGWDQLREERLQRLVDEGIIEPDSELSVRDPRVPAWEDVQDKDWETARMAVYAAQIDRMDQGIGQVLDALERRGRLDNTIVIFLSDNGGCAEEMPPDQVEEFVTAFVPMKMVTREGESVVPGNVPGLRPGPESTYQSYGRAWANLSNTPFREYKHWVHEGGISTPLIMHWPAGLGTDARTVTQPAQLVDVMPTLLQAADTNYPDQRNGQVIPAPEGRSLLPLIENSEWEERTLFWEHEGNCAARRGRWKLVKKFGHDWELYDIDADRAEAFDVVGEYHDIVLSLSTAYEEWAERAGVIPREVVLDLYRRRGHGLPEE